MKEKDIILEFLMKDEIFNVNIINFIRNYPIQYIERVGNSVIVKGISDRNWIYISSKSEEELTIIKGRLDDNDKNFAVIEEWMIPILTKGIKLKWKLATMKLILYNDFLIIG